MQSIQFDGRSEESRVLCANQSRTGRPPQGDRAMNTVGQSDSFQLKCGVRLPDSPFTPLIWMEGLRPLEPEGLFAQRNCLSAPFYGVVKAVWLHVLLNDVWIKACSYTQLGGAVQGIIERSTVKLGFYRSVFNVPKWGQKCARAVGVDKEVFSRLVSFESPHVIPDKLIWELRVRSRS